MSPKANAKQYSNSLLVTGAPKEFQSRCSTPVKVEFYFRKKKLEISRKTINGKNYNSELEVVSEINHIIAAKGSQFPVHPA